MNLSYDVIIVGGGLAGACAAFHLSRTRRVLLLDAGQPASGASGVAAGLVNPIMSQRAKPVWRMEEALDALKETLQLSGASSLFRKDGVIRPAMDTAQAQEFQRAAERLPAHAAWLSNAQVTEAYPHVRAPYGALHVLNGGAIPVPKMVRRLLDTAIRQGANVETNTPVVAWDETESAATVRVKRNGAVQRVSARHVILALGSSWTCHPEFTCLRLHNVKGQSVRVQAPPGLNPERVPLLAGAGYVVPEGDSFVVGSSYEHTFSTLEPDPAQTRAILEKAAQMLPGLAEGAMLDETAGVRVNVPGTRLPMIGPLPGRSRIWIFTGLGSKGLLMAPLLAHALPGYLEAPEHVPYEVKVRLQKS